MRLLPRMFSVKAQIGIRMKDARFGEPALRDSHRSRPSHPTLLAAALRLLNTGEIEPPCGVPSSAYVTTPSCIAPALSHFPIRPRIPGSAMR
jgi:hypothetical protein